MTHETGYSLIGPGSSYRVSRKIIRSMLSSLFTPNAGTTGNRPGYVGGVTGVAAQGTLTIAEPVTDTNTMTIDEVVYTFRAEGTADEDGEIDLGADEAATKVNICAAILGTDGINTVHPTVTCEAAFDGDDLVLTAKSTGTAGNSIATTETITHASNVFDAATLGTTTAGVTEVIAVVGPVGEMYFDTTLGTPIWWDGTDTWLIAAGTDADA